MTKRIWTRDRLDVIQRLLSESMPYKEIAKEMGVSDSNLRFLIHKYKLKSLHGNSSKTIIKVKEKEDLARRLMFLQGLEERPKIPERVFTDEELLSWVGGSEGCMQFCSELISEEMQPFQREMTEKAESSRLCVFCLGRGCGKDYWASLYLLWKAVTKPIVVMVVSQGQRQSDLLMNKIHTHIVKNDKLFGCIKKSTMEELEFTNGSRILSLPSTGFIRGHQNIDLIVVNEAAHVPNSREVVEGTLMPMLAGENPGSMVLMSTPLNCSEDNAFWVAWNSKLYSRIRYPTSVSKYRDKEFLKKQEQLMPADTFRREYLAEFTDVQNAFFDSNTIDRQSADYALAQLREKGKEYYFGWDAARVRDASVLCVVSKDKSGMFRVEYIRAFHNTPFPEQETTIKYLYELFQPEKFVAEYAGLSMGSIDHLLKDDIEIEKFTPTADSKLRAYDHLKLKFEQGVLTIPLHDKLITELKFFQFKSSPSGKTLLHHSSGHGDDYADALMMATWATHNEKPEFVCEFL